MAEADPNFKCPPENDPDGEAVLLANPVDCHTYYVCDWGVPILMGCPEGLYFNAALRVCAWPEDSGCVQPE